MLTSRGRYVLDRCRVAAFGPGDRIRHLPLQADQRPILGAAPATQRDEPETVGIRQISTEAVSKQKPTSL